MLWAYLPCYADKEGRLEDRPLFLKGQVFPGDTVDVSAMLDLFVARKFVIRYVDHEGRRLIQINHFHRYQRPDHHEKSSDLPAPENWEPAKRYGANEENAQATPRQRPGKTPAIATSVPDCHGKAAPGLRDSGTPVFLSGSSSISASGSDQSNPRAKSAHDWLEFFKARHRDKTGRFYGQGKADMAALGSLGDLLASLPDDQRSLDWDARERIVSEFLARSDKRTIDAGWPFCFFATDFRGLALPPDKRPRPDQRTGQPAQAHYEFLEVETDAEQAERRRKFAEERAKDKAS